MRAFQQYKEASLKTSMKHVPLYGSTLVYLQNADFNFNAPTTIVFNVSDNVKDYVPNTLFKWSIVNNAKYLLIDNFCFYDDAILYIDVSNAKTVLKLNIYLDSTFRVPVSTRLTQIMFFDKLIKDIQFDAFERAVWEWSIKQDHYHEFEKDYTIRAKNRLTTDIERIYLDVYADKRCTINEQSSFFELQADVELVRFMFTKRNEQLYVEDFELYSPYSILPGCVFNVSTTAEVLNANTNILNYNSANADRADFTPLIIGNDYKENDQRLGVIFNQDTSYFWYIFKDFEENHDEDVPMMPHNQYFIQKDDYTQSEKFPENLFPLKWYIWYFNKLKAAQQQLQGYDCIGRRFKINNLDDFIAQATKLRMLTLTLDVEAGFLPQSTRMPDVYLHVFLMKDVKENFNNTGDTAFNSDIRRQAFLQTFFADNSFVQEYINTRYHYLSAIDEEKNPYRFLGQDVAALDTIRTYSNFTDFRNSIDKSVASDYAAYNSTQTYKDYRPFLFTTAEKGFFLNWPLGDIIHLNYYDYLKSGKYVLELPFLTDQIRTWDFNADFDYYIWITPESNTTALRNLSVITNANHVLHINNIEIKAYFEK